MVIWPGVEPGYQCLWSLAAGARRLVGPADRSGTEPAGRSRRLRVLPAAGYCSRDANNAYLVREAWLQSRRLVGAHCSHTWSYPLTGMRASGLGTAAHWSPPLPESG